MKSTKRVWVELSPLTDLPIRIFKTESAARYLVARGGAIVAQQMLYGEAVGAIRRQLWRRCRGYCEFCGSDILEKTSHMHERSHRGRGGEISLDNSAMACDKCHKYQHRDRNPKFTRRIS